MKNGMHVTYNLPYPYKTIGNHINIKTTPKEITKKLFFKLNNLIKNVTI
jgi:hypothetical protein